MHLSNSIQIKNSINVVQFVSGIIGLFGEPVELLVWSPHQSVGVISTTAKQSVNSPKETNAIIFVYVESVEWIVVSTQ